MAGKTRKSANRSAHAADAVALLKADHRQVEGWFAQFSKSRSNARKQQLAAQICAALRVHTEIEEMNAGDDYFEAKVTVLSEMIKHHVKEEEQPGGMFAEAKKSKMDLKALGEELRARKGELQAHDRAA